VGRTDSQRAVLDTLRSLRVAEARRLAEQLECSTKTIRRALASIGYFTGINHNGTFVTLREVPQFDQQGLWSFDAVRFSKHGNLPQTIQQPVRQAAAGLRG
jgi:DNA-binding GntR family transcriptional regulator